MLFPGGQVFLDCQSIAEHHHQFLQLADDIGDEDWWMPSWIPVLAEPDAHYGLIVEAGHSEEKTPVLAYCETDDARPCAASLSSSHPECQAISMV
ncbi:hypothetical protein ACFYZ9_19875 [Streptomyces sp. NPDC001691]|uniref:hypothetical protein n=1 Tax=Streptomyces sp. NPDC001691 TaxID=3364600 RepID=UPI00369654C3